MRFGEREKPKNMSLENGNDVIVYDYRESVLEMIKIGLK